MKIRYQQNWFLQLSNHLLSQYRSFPRRFHSNLVWIMKYSNFSKSQFCWFSISYPFYYYEASDLASEIMLVFQKAKRCCWVLSKYWKKTSFQCSWWQIWTEWFWIKQTATVKTFFSKIKAFKYGFQKYSNRHKLPAGVHTQGKFLKVLTFR